MTTCKADGCNRKVKPKPLRKRGPERQYCSEACKWREYQRRYRAARKAVPE